MTTERIEDLLKWVVEYNYTENDKTGIGVLHAKIRVRDDMQLGRDFKEMTKAEEIYLVCSLIEKVAYPCEDYADDFTDDSCSFGYKCKWEDGIVFDAVFRV